jgi:putative membrane protein
MLCAADAEPAESGVSGSHAPGPARSLVDPDSRARTHLANERTFLAWLRTGLGMIVLGLAVGQFIDVDRDLVPGIRAVSNFAAALIIAGTLIVLTGSARYFRGRDQIDAAQYQPAGRGIGAATGLVVVIAVLSLALVYLLGR